MQTLPTISIFSLGVLGLVACATSPSGPPSSGPPDPPTGQVDLEIRNSGAAVAGSSFQCTGSWPSPQTPCGYSWTSQPTTVATSDGAGKVRVRMTVTNAGPLASDVPVLAAQLPAGMRPRWATTCGRLMPYTVQPARGTTTTACRTVFASRARGRTSRPRRPNSNSAPCGCRLFAWSTAAC